MDEGFRRKVQDFLTGNLDKKGTIEVLDQVKRSEVCRRYLEEQARVVASARRMSKGSSSSSAHACETVIARPESASEIAEVDDTDWSGVYASRKRSGLRRTVLLGLAVLIVTAVSTKLLKKPDQPIDPILAVAAAEIDQGNPVITAPRAGSSGNRPMAVVALLPIGNDSAKLLVFGAKGPLLEIEHRHADAGADFVATELEGPLGKIRAVEALLPFPGAESLALVDGERYFLTVELPNGRRSGPVGIDYRRN